MTPLPDHVVVTPAQAEADWKRDVETIRRLVTPLSSRIVEMVQVNVYIVSIRAVAEIIPETVAPEGHLEILSPQPAGSSSSHWSLSSPFSSYSPFAI